MFTVLLLMQTQDGRQSKFSTNGNPVNNVRQNYGALFGY